MPFIKFSLLFLYRRLFPQKWVLYASWTIGIIVMGWLISTTVVQIVACIPVAYYWDRTIPGGHCLNYNLFYIITVGSSSKRKKKAFRTLGAHGSM
jgi:hypothetical protein